jgi:hypothetical protein
MPRALPAVLGSIALLATTAILVVHIILAGHIARASPVRTTAVISAVLEGLALAVLGWLFSTYLIITLPERTRRHVGISFGISVLVCTLATASSVATMICLSNGMTDLADLILGSNSLSFLVGSSVALGLSFASQLIFIVIHFVLARIPGHGMAHSLHTEEEARRSPPIHVKSIPYSQTSPNVNRTRGSTSIDSRSPPGSSGGRSAAETMSSIRSSLSNVVRPMSSKTRLLSTREKRRPASLDSTAPRERGSVTEDGFDSWDTSAVDPHNRQTVMETSSPPTRFLETIPASPTTSRSASPGCPLDLEPPRSRRRSRSYSPAAQRRPQRPAFTQQPSTSESHIHPLFRSDSPTPPPATTPGTVVLAAPNAGQIISDRQSIRSLSRMRSGSLPATPVISSPLSRQGSFDDFFMKKQSDEQRKEMRGMEEVEEVREEEAPLPMERKMTPPIPDWILSAGTRTSLSGYNSRKLKIDAEPERPRT